MVPSCRRYTDVDLSSAVDSMGSSRDSRAHVYCESTPGEQQQRDPVSPYATTDGYSIRSVKASTALQMLEDPRFNMADPPL